MLLLTYAAYINVEVMSPEMRLHIRRVSCRIDPFTVYVTGKFEVRSAHVGVRTFIPSHCVNQRISRQDKT